MGGRGMLRAEKLNGCEATGRTVRKSAGVRSRDVGRIHIKSRSEQDELQ